MEEFIEKYHSLSPETQQEVKDFIDFLASKKKKKVFNMKSWKKKILDISVWSTSEIKSLSKNRISSWKPSQW